MALPLASFPANDELSRNTATLLAWLASTGFSADIEGLRRQYPETDWRTLEQWAAVQDW